MVLPDVVSASHKAGESMPNGAFKWPCDLCPHAVLVVQDGPEPRNVEPLNGFWCHNEVVCGHHRCERLGKEMCEACADAFDLDEATAAAESDIQRLYDVLARATNQPWAADAKQLREIARKLDACEAGIRKIRNEMPEKIMVATTGRVA